jgi:hypothetical protein
MIVGKVLTKYTASHTIKTIFIPLIERGKKRKKLVKNSEAPGGVA